MHMYMYMYTYVYVYVYVYEYVYVSVYVYVYVYAKEGGRSSSSSFVSPIAVDEIYIIMHYHEFVLSLNTHYHLRAKSIYWSKSIYYGVYMLLAKSTPVSHGNSLPPYPPPSGNYTIWQTSP